MQAVTDPWNDSCATPHQQRYLPWFAVLCAAAQVNEPADCHQHLNGLRPPTIRDDVYREAHRNNQSDRVEKSKKVGYPFVSPC